MRTGAASSTITLMGIKQICAAVLFVSVLSVFSVAEEERQCFEVQSLMTFMAGGNPLPADKIKLIGAEYACDNWGGEQVYTPKHNIFVYVNFNISGVIDLDFIDKTFEEKSIPTLKERLRKVRLVLVTSAQMKRLRGADHYVSNSANGDTLYISERALADKKLGILLTDFYSSFEAPSDEAPAEKRFNRTMHQIHAMVLPATDGWTNPLE